MVARGGFYFYYIHQGNKSDKEKNIHQGNKSDKEKKILSFMNLKELIYFLKDGCNSISTKMD